MNINWKLRLQNKTTLVTLCTALITAVYGILAALGITPSITAEQVTNLVLTGIGILTALGIVVDPTTQGIRDSANALEYQTPANDCASDLPEEADETSFEEEE